MFKDYTTAQIVLPLDLELIIDKDDISKVTQASLTKQLRMFEKYKMIHREVYNKFYQKWNIH